MADVFISYSRKDRDFVRKLHAALAGLDRDVWVDWEDIPPSAEWLKEIDGAIEAADTFIFVMSPDSVTSKTCMHEVLHAEAQNKRIIPVVARDATFTRLPEVLKKLNWLFLREEEDFDTAFGQLMTTIDTDLDWVRLHTRLLVRAREWEGRERDKSYQMLGTDLEDAEEWLAHATNHEPKPTQLHIEYVRASHQGAIELQRTQLRGFYIISLIYGIVQALATYGLLFEDLSETRLVQLSPIWLLGIVFGLFGLTLGRTSLKRSVIATVAAGVALYLFFIVLWPSL